MSLATSNFAARSVIAQKAAYLQEKVNRYEAAIPVTPDRPFLPAFVRDARYDANSFSRWEIARKVRYFFRNTWLLNRLCEEDKKYVVGPHGLQVVPNTSDAEFNKVIADAYGDWCDAPFRDSDLSMGQGHRLMWGEAHMDGEVFGNCTSLKWRGQQSKPAIELIESHRCSSPGVDYDYPKDGDLIVDGVKLGVDAFGRKVGRPSAFFIRDGVDGDEWSELPAFSDLAPQEGGVVHVYDPDRIGMYRAISGYAPIINQTADLELLAVLEMDRAKQNSEDGKVFKTWNGELPQGMQGVNQNFLTPPTPGTAPPIPGTLSDDDLNKRISQMRKVLGARIVTLKPGESMEYPENTSPSAATQWLWKLVIEQIAVTKNIPMILALPDSMQGTVTRAVLDDADLSFKAKYAIAARAAKRFYRFFVSWAIHNIPKIRSYPPDWGACTVTPPRSVNVDKGKNTTANLALLAAGARSWDDEASEDGSTSEERFRRKARNIATAKKIAADVSKEFGVPVLPAEIIEPIGNVAVNLAKANQSQGGEDDDEPKAKD